MKHLFLPRGLDVFRFARFAAPMKPSRFAAMTVLGTLLFTGVHAAAPGPAARPNVIVIVSDNQGYRDLGCFGSKEVVTPNLDRLAAEGVKATTFYATSPACTPSRGSILTGRYPQRNGLFEMIRNEMVSYGHRYRLPAGSEASASACELMTARGTMAA
jgi:hypothetical protein